MLWSVHYLLRVYAQRQVVFRPQEIDEKESQESEDRRQTTGDVWQATVSDVIFVLCVLGLLISICIW